MANPTYKYSNNVDAERAYNALKNRVKWMSEIAQPSESGRYVDDLSFHAIVREKTVRDSYGDSHLNDNDWSTIRTRIIQAAIYKVVTAVFSDLGLIDSGLLMESINHEQISMPSADFVGYTIFLPPNTNITARINKCILHFSDACTLKLYVYEDGETAPFWEHPVILTDGGYNIIDMPDCYLPTGKMANSRFFIGYKPSEVTGSAVPLGSNDDRKAGHYCFGYDYIESALPIDYDRATKPMKPAGINFYVSTFFDQTDKVVMNPAQFDEAIGLAAAAICVELIAYSSRINPEVRNTKSPAAEMMQMLDLSGVAPISGGPYTTGIRKRLADEIFKIKRSFLNKGTTGVISDALY